MGISGVLWPPGSFSHTCYHGISSLRRTRSLHWSSHIWSSVQERDVDSLSNSKPRDEPLEDRGSPWNHFCWPQWAKAALALGVAVSAGGDSCATVCWQFALWAVVCCVGHSPELSVEPHLSVLRIPFLWDYSESAAVAHNQVPQREQFSISPWNISLGRPDSICLAVFQWQGPRAPSELKAEWCHF